MRAIVALSGGKSSFWCANWAFENYNRDDVILYFNDTKWEHPDLYRFLDDISTYFGHVITLDSDGRNPETLFHDHSALANNRMPFCSVQLKAKRLQDFYKDGDVIIFGIKKNEINRATRLIQVYGDVGKRKNKEAILEFPIITFNVSDSEIDSFLNKAKIEEPLLYKLGFTHNNCSGGCVRAGKKQWKLLYETLPDVYLERERVEREFREFFGKDVHFLKDMTLERFRKQIEGKGILINDHDDVFQGECIGVCGFTF